MEFHRLTSARDALFDEAFALYESSFPKHEQRSPDKQAALMPNPAYHFDAIVSDGVFTGILLHWDGFGYTYVEHFAIHPALRGKSAGSKILKAFCKNRPCVILEIDPPDSPIAVRRAGFYQRLGFYVNGCRHTHPAYRKPFSPHELVVLSYPKPITRDEYRAFHRELKEIFMKDAAE